MTEGPVQERVRAGDVTLLVERRGPADGPVAFLHPGAGADHHALAPQAKHLHALGYTTLVPDSRGIGGSDRPPDGYDIRTMTEDALAVLDAYRAPNVLLVGQSLGSAIVQEMALADPGRFSGLILMATWCRSDAYLSLQFTLTQALVSAHPPEVYGRALLYLIASRPYLTRSGQDLEGLLKGMFLGRRAPEKASLLAHLGAGRDHDTASRLPALDLPSLVLTGERDLMIPPSYGEETAAILPRARHVRLAGERASHLFHWEMEEEVRAAVSAFVDSLA